MHKIYKLSPQSVSKYNQKLRAGLSDKDPSVMGVSLTLLHDEVKTNPLEFKDLVESLVQILRNILDKKIPNEYVYHRMPAPWMLIKVLQILGLLCNFLSI